MKILFCDFLFENGNRHVDNFVIDLLAQDNDVYLAMNEDFVCREFINKKNVHILGNKYKETPSRYRKKLIQCLKRMFLASQYDRRINADIIYVSVYDTRVFSLGQFFFRNKKRIYIVENNNIDFLRFKSYRKAYNTFSNKVHHIVYEGLFKDFICNKMGVNSDLVHVIPHVQYRNEYSEDDSVIDPNFIFDCIAISGSNEDLFIKELIRFEETYCLFEKNRIRVLIKSHKIKYETPYLKVICDYIPIDKYNQLYKQCKVVYAPFPSSYKYRMSGCYVDSFSNHRPIVATDIELAKYYHERYGNIIKPCSSIRESVDEIVYFCNNNVCLNFDRFERDHSIDEVNKALRETIKK